MHGALSEGQQKYREIVKKKFEGKRKFYTGRQNVCQGITGSRY